MNILYMYYEVNIVRVENNKLSLFYFSFIFYFPLFKDKEDKNVILSHVTVTHVT